MCVYSVSKIKILEKNTHYYKVAQPTKTSNIYRSLVLPKDRAIQTPTHLYGTSSMGILKYEIGKKVTSDLETTPGMYCYINKEIAKASLFSFDRNKKTVLLKVLVKKGTKIRYASNSVRTNNKNVVLVETLTPVKVGQMD